MTLHRIHKKQLIKRSITELWEFINNPLNLAVIMPPKMQFKTLGDLKGKKIHLGQITEYKVSPLTGINLHWVTEITQVKHLEYFVDEHRFGPYSFWHHKHTLVGTPMGIEMYDDIHHKIPMGAIGRLLNKLFISKNFEYIFEYRKKNLRNTFQIRIINEKH